MKDKIKVSIEGGKFEVSFRDKKKTFSMPDINEREKDFLAMIAVRELINNLPTVADKLEAWQSLEDFVRAYLERNFYKAKKREKRKKEIVW